MTEENKLREALADLEHEQWNSACSYILDTIGREADEHIQRETGTGFDLESLDCVQRWRRQEITPYPELTEKEKESDRVWADKAIEIMERINGPTVI